MMKAAIVYTSEVEKVFVQTAVDLKAVIILDGIDPLTQYGGFRFRSHDMHGPLPDLFVNEAGDPLITLRNVRHATCKLAAIVHIRDEIARLLPGLQFPPGSLMRAKGGVGMKLQSDGTSAEVDLLLEQYRALRSWIIRG